MDGKSHNTFSADLQPERYTYIEDLGEGGFGILVKCLDMDTRDIVAVKIPKCHIDLRQEVTILRQLMDKDMDDCNIVKFYGCFDIIPGPALVFENLDITLEDYMLGVGEPLLLNDIRIITKQVATALNALKSAGVIHTDIKPDNIMLVNQTRPFKVKLIDFGLAINKSQARQGMTLQTISFRSPEIILGLPFSEAIDMWALGQLVFPMLFGCLLIKGKSEYEAMRLIVHLLGVPPDDLLNQGLRTHLFFTKAESETWRLKTAEEYLGKGTDVTFVKYKISSLDELKPIYRKRKDKAEAEQGEQCIELFKATMTMDESQRITPLGVLSHPFITQDDHQDYQDHQDLQDHQDHQDHQDLQDHQDYQDHQDLQDHQDYQDYQDLQDHQDHQGQERTTDEGTIPPPTAPRSPVIQVLPAAAENTLQLEDEERACSLQAGPNKASKVSCDGSIQSPAMTEESKDKQQKKKKKKKNLCQRFCSWIRRTFCCNRVGVIG